MSEQKVIRKNLEHGVVEVTLSDPATRNAMSVEMGHEFRALVTELKSDRSVRVVILRGEGKAFSAGGHLDMLFEKTKIEEKKNAEMMMEFYHSFLCVGELEIPVIAAINGHAVGAGLCLALACDIRLCNREAKLGLNFVNLGLHPGMGVTYFLPRLINYGAACELLFCGKIVSADDGYRLGIVNHIIPPAEFNARVTEMAREIAAAGPQSVRALKKSLQASMSRTLEQCLQREAEAQAADYVGKEFLEGITAAKEKRPALF